MELTKMELTQELLNKPVFTTINVITGFPVTRIFHDDDGDWQFFSNQEDMTEESARVISLGEILEIDNLLEKVILHLPKGYEAYREKMDRTWCFRNGDETILFLS